MGSPLNAGDVIGIDSLPLMSGIKVVSLFGATCPRLHELRTSYIRIIIIIVYICAIMVMIR